MQRIVDGHLDLAFNVTEIGRNLELSIAAIRQSEAAAGGDLAMVSLPELKRADVAVAFATLYAMPSVSWTHPEKINPRGYSTPLEAERQGLAQLAVYEDWAARGLVRIIKSVADLNHHLELWRSDGLTGLVILMEGADPIVAPDDLPKWWDRGLRIIATSWGRTRYAGGTDSPGGLTVMGRELIAGMKSLGVILDASHQSWESFWESLEIGVHRVIASHSNAFALRSTTNRHLTDAMISAIGARDGAIGVVLLNGFLDARWSREDRRIPVTIDGQVRAHLEHMAGLIGWDRLGIGSDLDGGFGSRESPGMDTIADLHRIAEVVPDHARAGVLGENWLNLLRRSLPASS